MSFNRRPPIHRSKVFRAASVFAVSVLLLLACASTVLAHGNIQGEHHDEDVFSVPLSDSGFGAQADPLAGVEVTQEIGLRIFLVNLGLLVLIILVGRFWYRRAIKGIRQPRTRIPGGVEIRRLAREEEKGGSAGPDRTPEEMG